MDQDQAVVFLIIMTAFLFFVWGRWRYDLVAMVTLLASVALGAVPISQAFSGFAHPAVITVASVLIISRCFLESQLTEIIFRIISKEGSTITRQSFPLAGLVAILSGFMNNVGALSLLMPVGIRIAHKSGNPPSLYLMTMAFASLLGGLVTLIGTPPNIIISSFREESTGQPFSMFDFAPVGLAVALVGLIFISSIGWRLIPIRKDQAQRGSKFEVNDYYTEVRVPEDSMFSGRSLHDLRTAAGPDVQFLGLLSAHRSFFDPSGEEILQPGDILMIKTSVENLNNLLNITRLEIVGADIGESSSEKTGLMEAVVMNNSLLVGRSVGCVSLRQEYGINLIAVAGRDIKNLKRPGQIILYPGDVLLLQSSPESFAGIMKLLGCLPLADRGLKLGPSRNILPLLAIFALAVIASILSILPVEIALAGAATILVLMGMLTLQEAYESIDWSIIILLGAMIPVGHALESSGGAQLLASNLLLILDQFQPAVILIVLLIWTMILTNVINNAAAAVLMAPIAYDTAQVIGASADPFLMTIAIGASCAFLTPIGHQSNTLVMGPGGYRFSDYWHMGLPLSIIVVLVALPLIMWFWPLF